MATYSIYWNHCDERLLPPGNVLDGARLEELKPWFMVELPTANTSIGSDHESWSCFRALGFQFVVRTLIRSGVRDGLLSGFTHARVWGCGGKASIDPGAMLGRSDAFAGRFPNCYEHDEPPAPEMVWSDLVRAEREASVRLLSQIYHARLEGRPIVIVASHEEFVAGGRVHGLVAFARAALPMALKADLRVRIGTRRPGQFLGALDAGVVVIESFQATEAMRSCRDAMLLTSDGDPLDRAMRRDDGYGRAIVGRVLKLPEFPSSLFDFTARFRPEMPVHTASIVYNFAAASKNPDFLKQLLEMYLAKVGAADTPWKEIVVAEV